MRLPNDALYHDLLAREGEWTAAGIGSVQCIGDALAPGLIVHAVYAGHRYAREFEAVAGENGDDDGVPFRRVRIATGVQP
jgi:dimethylamine/trimethylamine dehydrogenase